jgi:hypothetical protein
MNFEGLSEVEIWTSRINFYQVLTFKNGPKKGLQRYHLLKIVSFYKKIFFETKF